MAMNCALSPMRPRNIWMSSNRGKPEGGTLSLISSASGFLESAWPATQRQNMCRGMESTVWMIDSA